MKRLILLLIAFVLAGCSGPGAHLALQPVGVDAAAATVATDSGALPATAFSLAFPPEPGLTVEPGAEGLHCIDLPGPAVDTWVSGWHARRESGIHHFNVRVRTPGTPPEWTTLTPCGSTQGKGSFVLDDSQPDLVNDFGRTRPGAALLLPGGSDIILEVHFYNPTTDAIPERAHVDFFVADSHEFPVNALSLTPGSNKLSVAPHSEQTVSFECIGPPKDRDVVSLGSHSHAHNVAFAISLDGTERYRSTTWTDPVLELFGPREFLIESGSRVGWSCTIQNTTEKTLSWGATVQTSEMCNVQALAVGPAWSCGGTLVP